MMYAKSHLPTPFGDFILYCFVNRGEHLVLVKPYKGVPLVRIHSKCTTGDALFSLRCDCRAQLKKALELIGREGGVFIYLDQEGRGIGLKDKIRAYALQDEGYDTVEANLKLGFKADERDYSACVEIFRALNIKQMRLLTNNPAKVDYLRSKGFKVEAVPLRVELTPQNREYIKAKREKLKHNL